MYVAVFRLTYPYLGIFSLNCPDFTMCIIFTLYTYSSIETAPLCKILEQSDHYSWRYCISKIWGIRVSFGCERSCSSIKFQWQRTSGGIYPHIKFERDRLNIFRVRVFTSSRVYGRTRRTRTRDAGADADAAAMLKPWYHRNTSFGDIIKIIKINN